MKKLILFLVVFAFVGLSNQASAQSADDYYESSSIILCPNSTTAFVIQKFPFYVHSITCDMKGVSIRQLKPDGKIEVSIETTETFLQGEIEVELQDPITWQFVTVYISVVYDEVGCC